MSTEPKTPNVQSNIHPMTAALLDVLGRLDNEFENRAEHWRTTPNDPHHIATALMAAMEECKSAVRAVIAEINPAGN